MKVGEGARPSLHPAHGGSNSEARPWPRKQRATEESHPFPTASLVPAPARVQTWVGGPDAWPHLQPGCLCIPGINFPKELLSEFDL